MSNSVWWSRLAGGVAALAAAALLAVPTTASAQAYPTKPVRVIVGYAAGGPVDIVARTIGPALSDALGQQVYVENRPGANGTIGAAAVAKAEPDGYTLILISAGTAAIAPHMYSKMPYDTLTDLVPVAMVSSTPQMLAVHPSVSANNVGELVALAKAKPGTLSIASVGVGSLSHLALELLKMETKADLLHVPHNGGAPAVTSALGGQVTGVIADLPVLKPLVASGQLRALGLAAPKRSPFFPELATMPEQGLPNVRAANWYGFVAPANTPPAIITRLNEATVKILNDPAMRQKLIAVGAEAMPGTPADSAAFLKTELDRWGPIVKAAGARVN